MTENKEKQNAEEMMRSNFKQLFTNAIPALDKYAETLYKQLEPRLEEIKSEVKPSAAEFLRTKQLATEYMTYQSFGYFARLIAQLQDSIETIRDALPETQKQRLNELDEKAAEVNKKIDSHFAKRLGELFSKDGAGYIG